MSNRPKPTEHETRAVALLDSLDGVGEVPREGVPHAYPTVNATRVLAEAQVRATLALAQEVRDLRTRGLLS